MLCIQLLAARACTADGILYIPQEGRYVATHYWDGHTLKKRAGLLPAPAL